MQCVSGYAFASQACGCISVGRGVSLTAVVCGCGRAQPMSNNMEMSSDFMHSSRRCIISLWSLLAGGQSLGKSTLAYPIRFSYLSVAGVCQITGAVTIKASTLEEPLGHAHRPARPAPHARTVHQTSRCSAPSQ